MTHFLKASHVLGCMVWVIRRILFTIVKETLKTMKEILKQVFGFNDFRPHQEAIITNLLAGRDVMAVSIPLEMERESRSERIA